MRHNAHARPPASIRELFKEWRKRPASEIRSDPTLIDPLSPDPMRVSFLLHSETPQVTDLDTVVRDFCGHANTTSVSPGSPPGRAFEIKGLPGLQVFPSLLPPRVQLNLLDKLLHRNLSNPAHKTNLHLHHHVQYPEDNQDSSFFAEAHNTTIQPKDPTLHKPITYAQMLESKLRWITLGGQYDWTNKVYPNEIPPTFPADIATLLKHLFSSVDAQAAIVNFYSPGDTLSIHRDVSEECDRDLVSISIGCDGIFLVGNDEGTAVPVRLRSGDAVLMSGASRYAWHGVPRILAGTCPEWLRDWPDVPGQGPYRSWRGWMNNKRINLNVRQITETSRDEKEPQLLTRSDGIIFPNEAGEFVSVIKPG
ncbi:hypothetical protein H2200_004244 [Cladophialophora chaetospira]|uniref:mRNA N(6)-methyladenine demethylase n=1 Tax=Cladophialophora chaetospira TaxID=386627 RepID=A0AA38XFU6_9EURO|nr:hypothetical protein H2200_004244 [Cladophialophora chaetospira]